MIKNPPDDVTLADIRYHLAVLQKIKRGQQSLVTAGGLSQDEMERDLARWILP